MPRSRRRYRDRHGMNDADIRNLMAPQGNQEFRCERTSDWGPASSSTSSSRTRHRTNTGTQSPNSREIFRMPSGSGRLEDKAKAVFELTLSLITRTASQPVRISNSQFYKCLLAKLALWQVVKFHHRFALAAIKAKPRQRRRPRSIHRLLDGLDASDHAKRETALQRRV